MPQVKLIHHVNVQISDRQRTREWYEKVLGAEFLDRGPALNRRQLQLRIGSGEMHFTETPEPIRVPSVHFAVEVDNWEATLAHLTQTPTFCQQPIDWVADAGYGSVRAGRLSARRSAARDHDARRAGFGEPGR